MNLFTFSFFALNALGAGVALVILVGVDMPIIQKPNVLKIYLLPTGNLKLSIIPVDLELL